MYFLDEKDLAALENIFNDTVYYLIKSGNEENVSLAKAKVMNNIREYSTEWVFFCRVYGQHRQLMRIN